MLSTSHILVCKTVALPVVGNKRVFVVGKGEEVILGSCQTCLLWCTYIYSSVGYQIGIYSLQLWSLPNKLGLLLFQDSHSLFIVLVTLNDTPSLISQYDNPLQTRPLSAPFLFRSGWSPVTIVIFSGCRLCVKICWRPLNTLNQCWRKWKEI